MTAVSLPNGPVDGVTVTLDDATAVGVVEFSRPPTNYFTVALVTGIVEAFDALATEGGCRAGVLKSTGRHFCAGAALSQPVDAPDGPHLYDIGARLFHQPLPIVAAVQGAAIGGGLGLALAADFRVASEKAWFAANFSRLGFHHGFALTVTLPAAVGQQAALDLLYTGRRVDAVEAHTIGLCDRLVATDDLDAAAIDFAIEIASAAPLAVRSIKQTMRSDLVRDVQAAMAHERVEQTRLMQTADFTEGVAAVAERREPVFHGR